MPKSDIILDRMFRGIDSTTPPHLVEDGRWTSAVNFRSRYGKVTQIPHKVSIGNFPGGGEIQEIIAIPTGNRNQALHVGLGQTKIYQLRETISSSVELKQNGSTLTLSNPGGYRRWATTLYARQLWFANEYNSLRYTNGAQVGQYSTNLPYPRYLESWFDHMVVGCYRYKGNWRPTGVKISGLYDPSIWDAEAGNESGLFDFEEYCQGDLPMVAVTGIKRLNDFLIVYTPSAIIRGTYTGLPKVFNFVPVTENAGNGLMYGLASHKTMHFFFDPVEQDFMLYDGTKLQPIGGPVLNYFASELSTDYDIQQRTWAYVNREQYEVHWVFQSAGGSDFDREIFFNWRTNEWHHSQESVAISGFGGYGKRATTVGELSGTVEDLDATVENLSSNEESAYGRLWSARNGSNSRLVREEVTGDADNTMLTQETPTLITKDFSFSGPSGVKELDSVYISASYGGGCTGIQVYVSARELHSDAVTYSLVGTWTPTAMDKKVTFAGIAGKIFRLKFVFAGSNIRNIVWSAFGGSIVDEGAVR